MKPALLSNPIGDNEWAGVLCCFIPHFPVPRTMASSERTFIAIKPDGVQRGLVGDIIKRFEQKGFRLVALKLIQVMGLHLSVAF